MTKSLTIIATLAWLSGCASSSEPLPGAAGSAAGGALPSTGGAAAAGIGGTSPSSGAAASGSAGLAGQASTGGASAAGAAAGGASGAGAGAAGAAGAGGQPPNPNAVDTIAVPVSGEQVTGKVALQSGDLFLLKATGSLDAAGTSLDAEFGGFAPSTTGEDSVSSTDVGVDVGFKLERAPNGMPLGRKKWFGSYRADHAYYMVVTGTGAPLSGKLLRPAGTSGTGSITVSAMQLSRSAPALAPALETVMAPVTKENAYSTLTTQQGVVYLLQAVGSLKVGGLNLALGDADWMDYTADGAGKVDIGDENVDYGLGVDETDPKKTPRAHWWGPWRKDHDYFMLFAGTGQTVTFHYYDVGDYGDNTKTEKLTVRLFSVP